MTGDRPLRRYGLALIAVVLFIGGCYAQRRETPVPGPTARPSALPSAVPTRRPSVPQVGLVAFSDISGHNAGPMVTDLLQARLMKRIKVVMAPGEGFLTGWGLANALKLADGAPVIQGRISAYDFQQQRTRRLGPPDYDAVEARAVVSLSIRLVAATAADPEGAVIWSRSLTGEDRAQWAENFRQEIGANPLTDSFVTPAGLMGAKTATSMLSRAVERAIDGSLPDLLRHVGQGDLVVRPQ